MEDIFIKEMRRLNCLIGETDSVYHEAAVKLGVSDSTMQILYTICMTGENYCQLSEIARLTGSSRQTIHSSVRKLEQEGVVCLKAKNGRDKIVYLTEYGKKIVEKTALRMIEIENDIFATWTIQDRQEYLRLTQKYLIDLKKRVDRIEKVKNICNKEQGG